MTILNNAFNKTSDAEIFVFLQTNMMAKRLKISKRRA